MNQVKMMMTSKTETTQDDYEDFAFFQNDVLCYIQNKLEIPRNWILLYSACTVNIFLSSKTAQKFPRCETETDIDFVLHSVRAIVTKKGNLNGYGTIWYHPEKIAKILSLKNLQKK